MRLPVVAFDSGGIKECFRDGISGFLVPQGDSRSAASKVLALLSDSELKSKIGAQAREDLLQKFSYENHFANVEQIYRLVLH